DEGLGGSGAVGPRSHADRPGRVNVEPVAMEKRMRVDALADALADGGRAFAPRVGQDQRELVAAETRHDVGFTRALPDDRAGLDQRAAAREVAMAIVDALEAVEVDEQQRQRTAAARRALGLAPQHLRQIA